MYRNFKAVVAAALCAAMVLPVAAQTGATAPISINSCGPMLDKNSESTLFGIPVASTSSGIQIVFTNDSQKTADLVNFAVSSNGDNFVIRDVGTFSPDIEITHRYRNGEGQSFVLPQFVSPNIKCAVQSVRFTDGSFWRPGAVPAQAAARGSTGNPLAANPSSIAISLNAESRLFMVTSSDNVAAFSERNTCTGIATVALAATGEAAATYSVKPVSAGSCMATVTDETGNTLKVGITVQP